MTRGGKLLLLSGCLAATGCATTHTVQVRAVSDPNSKLHYSGGLLAEARAQLAMGAVGLAIESFRTLQREQPDSVDAYAGLAASYAAMGRYDLTRTNYELALAYAPNDPALLQALASTLDKLGETEQAAQVRTEVRLAAAKAAGATLTASPVTPLGVPKATSMTVKLPQATPVSSVAQNTAPPIAAPVLSPARVDLGQAQLASMNKQLAAANTAFEMPPEEVPANVLALAHEAGARSGSAFNLPTASIAMRVVSASQLPQRAMQSNAALLIADAVAPPVPVTTPAGREPRSPTPSATVKAVAVESQSGPFLERTSLREVALITVARPMREARLRPREPQLPRLSLIAAPTADRPPTAPVQKTLLTAASLRWVPLRYASRPENIALLNAARRDGLAARTRVALVDRGWRKVAIGNARKVRQHSLVLYAPGRWHVAARLAAEFRCKAVKVASLKKNIVVLLGRDVASGRGSTLRA
jgi:hypothetical protein